MMKENREKRGYKSGINRPERAECNEKVEKPGHSIHQKLRLVEMNNFCVDKNLQKWRFRCETSVAARPICGQNSARSLPEVGGVSGEIGRAATLVSHLKRHFCEFLSTQKLFISTRRRVWCIECPDFPSFSSDSSRSG